MTLPSTLEGILLDTHFSLVLILALPSPSFSSIQAAWIWWPALFSPWNLLEIWPDLWPRRASSIMHFALVLSPASPSPSLSSIQATWIWPDLWPQLTSEGILLDTHFALVPISPVSPSSNLSSIRGTWSLTWPLNSGDLASSSEISGPCYLTSYQVSSR